MRDDADAKKKKKRKLYPINWQLVFSSFQCYLKLKDHDWWSTNFFPDQAASLSQLCCCPPPPPPPLLSGVLTCVARLLQRVNVAVGLHVAMVMAVVIMLPLVCSFPMFYNGRTTSWALSEHWKPSPENPALLRSPALLTALNFSPHTLSIARQLVGTWLVV